MDIRVFTLCDGAYNYNSKLTVVGTVDNLKVAKIPCIANVGLAIKVVFPLSEFGEKSVEIVFKNLFNGQQVLPPLQFQTTIKSEGPESALVIAANLNGLDIKTLGKYVVELNVNGSVYPLPFNVVQ